MCGARGLLDGWVEGSNSERSACNNSHVMMCNFVLCNASRNRLAAAVAADCNMHMCSCVDAYKYACYISSEYESMLTQNCKRTPLPPHVVKTGRLHPMGHCPLCRWPFDVVGWVDIGHLLPPQHAFWVNGEHRWLGSLTPMARMSTAHHHNNGICVCYCSRFCCMHSVTYWTFNATEYRI